MSARTARETTSDPSPAGGRRSIRTRQIPRCLRSRGITLYMRCDRCGPAPSVGRPIVRWVLHSKSREVALAEVIPVDRLNRHGRPSVDAPERERASFA